MIELLLLPVIGLVVGFLSALLGIGGGTLIIPSLVFIYGFPMPYAVGTSLGQIFFTALSGTFRHIKLKNVDFRYGFSAFLGTILGSYSVAKLITHYYVYSPKTKVIVEKTVTMALVIVMILIGIKMLLEKKDKGKEQESIALEKTEKDDFTLKKGILLFFIAIGIGVVGGTCGIGGGVLLVPAYIYIFGLEPRKAVGTSMFNVLLVGTVSGGVYYLNGFVKPLYVILIALGSMIGAQFGAISSRKIPGYTLKKVFGVFLIIIAFLFVFKKLI